MPNYAKNNHSYGNMWAIEKMGGVSLSPFAGGDGMEERETAHPEICLVIVLRSRLRKGV